LPLLFNFALGYVIRKAQENQFGLKINGTNRLSVYADDVNQLEDNIKTVKENIESLIDVSKDICINVNTKRIKLC
jgi:hypothetical protein